MKSRAFYNENQFRAKIIMSDEVWDDMDDEMLERVTQFEKHINSKFWQMFVEYLNLPNSYLKAENPYVQPKKDTQCGVGKNNI